MKWNLQKRILVPTITLVSVLTLVLGGAAYRMARTMVVEAYDQQLSLLCAKTVVEVESWIENYQKLLLALASDAQTLKALSGEAESKPLAEALSQMYAQTSEVYGGVEGISLLTPAGDIVAGYPKEVVGKLNLADRSYVKEALTGKMAVSEVLASRLSGQPIVATAVPVKAAGTVRGALFIVVRLDAFSAKFVTNTKVLTSGYAFLYDAQGATLAHRDAAKILHDNISKYDWGRQLLQVGDGQVDYVFGGKAKKVTFRRSNALHWGVAVTVPQDELHAPVRRMTATLWGIGGVVLAVGLLSVFLTARSITHPIQRVAAALSAGSDQTRAAAGQVSSSSQTLAEGASEQAASLEETGSSLEELSSLTKRNVENVEKASHLARHARQAADAGTADMATMNTSMEAIKASSDDIAKIIKTIDELAFQTNILALNAAVEAARAGEAGMGFAVVADEVRSLAQRSAGAAKETAAKIEGAISKTQAGVAVSAKVAERLKEIVTEVRQVDDLVAEVATASKEQSQGIEQVNLAVSQIDKVTQRNAASAEEGASAAEELNAQAEAVRDAVAELHSLVQGSRALPATSTGTGSSDPVAARSKVSMPARNGKPTAAQHRAAASTEENSAGLTLGASPKHRNGTFTTRRLNGNGFRQ